MSSYFRFVLFWLLLAHFCFLVCFYVGTICACHAAHSSCPFIVTANVSHRMRAKLSPTQSNTAQGNPSHRYCCPMSINLTSFVYMLNFVSHKMRVKLSPAQWYTGSQGNPKHHHCLLWFPFIVRQFLAISCWYVCMFWKSLCEGAKTHMCHDRPNPKGGQTRKTLTRSIKQNDHFVTCLICKLNKLYN